MDGLKRGCGSHDDKINDNSMDFFFQFRINNLVELWCHRMTMSPLFPSLFNLVYVRFKSHLEDYNSPFLCFSILNCFRWASLLGDQKNLIMLTKFEYFKNYSYSFSIYFYWNQLQNSKNLAILLIPSNFVLFLVNQFSIRRIY